MSKVAKGMVATGDDIAALEALIIDNPEFEQLEGMLDQFNIFEAVGAVRSELRHSDFLAFLLNPQQPHGLGDAFLKRLLQKVCTNLPSNEMPISPIDLDIWTLEDVLVQREWENIDILLLDEAHRLAVIVENKVGTSEHSDQLRRYHLAVSSHYPGWQTIGIYLTPSGDLPSDEEYIPLDYGTVCNVLESLAQSRATTLGPDVLTLVRHYTQMLRRYIVGDLEIADLCRRIYQKHQRALDLIFEFRPDRQAGMHDAILDLVQGTPGLASDYSIKTYIRFCPESWDHIPALRQGFNWTSTGRLLLFEVQNLQDIVSLKLIIGPGPQEVRERLFKLVSRHQHVLKAPYKTLSPKFMQIYGRTLISRQVHSTASFDELIEEVRKHWKTFVEGDLPAIVAGVTDAFTEPR